MLGVIIFIVIFTTGFYLYKYHPHKKRKRHAIKHISDISESVSDIKKAPYCSTEHPYHCVIVIHGEPSCQGAKSIINTCYLSHDAPEIPLEDCDIAQCHCHYVHKEDRRNSQSENRRLDFGVVKELYGTFGEKNRRQSRRGRRKEDRGESI